MTFCSLMSGTVYVTNNLSSTSGLNTAVGPHVLVFVTLHSIGLIYVWKW
jgi:hypothetical protein